MPVDLRLCLRVDLSDPAPGFAPEVLAAARAAATLVIAEASGLGDRDAVAALRALRSALPGGMPILAAGRADLALAVRAEGVCLGPSNLTPGDVRRLLPPDTVIGVDVEEAAQADELYRWRAEFACLGGRPGGAGGGPDALSAEAFGRLAFRVRLASPGTRLVAVANAGTTPSGLVAAGAAGFCVRAGPDSPLDVRAALDLRQRIDAALPRPFA